MVSPVELLRMDSTSALKTLICSHISIPLDPIWIDIRDIGIIEGTKSYVEFVINGGRAPATVASRFPDQYRLEFTRLDIGSSIPSSPSVPMRLPTTLRKLVDTYLKKFNILTNSNDFDDTEIDTHGSIVVIPNQKSPRWVGSTTFILSKLKYNLSDILINTKLFIKFSQDARSDNFKSVILAALFNQNTWQGGEFELTVDDFELSLPNALSANDDGLNTKVILTAVGENFAGTLEVHYQRNSYTKTYRNPVVVVTGGTPTHADFIDKVNSVYDTGLIESDISNWDTYPDSLLNQVTLRMTVDVNSYTTVGDIYTTLVLWDTSTTVPIETVIPVDYLPGIVVNPTCKFPLRFRIPEQITSGLIPKYPIPALSDCISVNYLNAFDVDKVVPLDQSIRITYLDAFDANLAQPISEITVSNDLDGYDSKVTYPISRLLSGTNLNGIDSAKKRLINAYTDNLVLDGFISQKYSLISQLVTTNDLAGYDSSKSKLLEGVIGESELHGFDGKISKSISPPITNADLGGFDSTKTKDISLFAEPSMDGFDPYIRLDDTIVITTLTGLNYPVS